MANTVPGTTNVWPYYATQNVQRAARTPVKELGKDQFLQLLVTQLRNQDPMQPMQDKEFIAQMAQFTSLEQMMNMSGQMTALRNSAALSASLIGKQVSWYETDPTTGTTSTRSGVVDAVVMRDGVQYVQVESKFVPVDELTSISLPGTEVPEMEDPETEEPGSEQPDGTDAEGGNGPEGGGNE